MTAWDQLGENCAKYLQKGKKVGVIGAVSVHPYNKSNGEAAATLEILASEVEFLSSRDDPSGYTRVTPPDDMPY